MYIKAKLKIKDSKDVGQFIRILLKKVNNIKKFSLKNDEIDLEFCLASKDSDLIDAITEYEIIEFSCENNSEIMESSNKSINVNMKKENLIEQITKLLDNLTIPVNVLGYEYIREAILISVYDSRYLKAITNMLYPELARRFETEPRRIERAIRHAIELAWNNEKINLDNPIISGTILAQKYKPTNGAFLATIADKFRIELNKV